MATRGMDVLVRSLVDSHPEDAARILEGLEPTEANRILVSLPARTIGRVAEKLSPHAAGSLLSQIEPGRARKLLESLPTRQAAAILERMDGALREAALSGMPERTVRQLRDLLRYPPGTAGAMMDTQVTSVPVDLSVEEAVAALRRAPRGTLYYLYVTDRLGKLLGVLNMRELLLAAPSDRIEPMVRTQVMTIEATAGEDDVAELMEGNRFVAMPVVDSEGHLIGVLKQQEVLAAVRQEAFADLQRMTGAGGDERALSPVQVVVSKRLPWLVVNLLTAFLAAAVVGLFEATIAKVTALAVLLPIVAGQGGNTGAQALAVVMRGIALREVLPETRVRLLRKELVGAFLNGAAVALVTATAVLLWDGRIGLALVIGLSMVVNMAAAGLSGAAIPLILQAVGKDPAQSSSIFLTTVTDVVGFGSFLGFAVLFMPMLGG